MTRYCLSPAICLFCIGSFIVHAFWELLFEHFKCKGVFCGVQESMD